MDEELRKALDSCKVWTNTMARMNEIMERHREQLGACACSPHDIQNPAQPCDLVEDVGARASKAYTGQ